MLSLFTRARAQLNLSPAERAFLKLVQGAFISVGLAVIPAAAQGLLLIFNAAGSAGFQWWPSVVLLGASLAHTAVTALGKYYTAHADEPLTVAFSAVSSGVASIATGLNDVKTPAPPLPSASPVPAN